MSALPPKAAVRPVGWCRVANDPKRTLATDFLLSRGLSTYMSKASGTAEVGIVATLADVCGEIKT